MADPLWIARLLPVQDKVVPLIGELLNGSLLDALVTASLLSDADCENVRAKKKQSDLEGARELISLLKKEPSPTFDTFCETLRSIEDGGVSRDAILKELQVQTQVTSCSALARDAATNPAAGGDRANDASRSCKRSYVESGEHQPSFSKGQLCEVERTGISASLYQNVVATCMASSFPSAKKAKIDEKPLRRSWLSSRFVIDKLIAIIEGRHDPQSVNELENFLSTEKGFRPEQFVASSSVLRFVAGREFESAEEADEWLGYLVLQKNKNLDESSRHGLCPLHAACEWGNIFGVRWLVEHGASVNAKDKSNRAPYYYACKSSLDALKKIVLLEEHGYVLSPADLVFAAERPFSSSTEAHDFFHYFVIEKGMSVNATDEGDTLLHSSCWFGSLYGVKWLQEHNADLNSANKLGRTPFMIACQSNRDRSLKVRYLDAKGAECLAKDKSERTALFYATHPSECEDDVKDVLQYLVSDKHIAIESVDEEGQTPLLHSCCQNPPSFVAIHQLLKLKANVFAKNKKGQDALHLAVKNDNTAMSIIDLFIKEGVHVKCEDEILHDLIPADAWSEDSTLDVYRGQRYQCNNPADIISPSSLVILQCCCFCMADVSSTMWKDGIKLLKLVDDKTLECLIKMSVQKGHHCIDVILRWSSKAECEVEAKKFLDDLKSKITEACVRKSPGVCLNWFYLDSSHLKRLHQDPAIYSSEEVKEKVKERNFKSLIFSTRPERESRSSIEDLVVLNQEEIGVESTSTINEVRQKNDDSSQEIYDEALKRGSVTVNRSRVIVAGQDGAGKSCFVDSLLNRPFEKDKASTEGAVVAMIHTATSGWEVTKDHLDPLIAEGVYRMSQQQSKSQEGSSESSHFVMESNDPGSEEDEADKSEHHCSPSTLAVETLAENLKTVGMEAKRLTVNQQQLVNTFLKNKPSEEELTKHILGVRDIWDLGGQEVYLATHSALMPDSKDFCLSMYMVVMDISRSLSDEAKSFHRLSDGEVIDQTNELGWIRTNGDFLLYWFGSITAAHEETPTDDHWLGKDEEVDPPPVFAIGSHRDVLDSDKERFPDLASVEKWLREQGERFEQLLSESDFMRHIVLPENENVPEMAHFVERIFLVDNSLSGSKSPCKGVVEIRERVDRMATTYWNGMKKKQPLFWVYLEILLFRWSKVMKTVVAKVDEVAKLAQDPRICNNLSREEVLVALKYLANVGAILYYPEVDGLKDVVFTRPMWVIKALSAIVTATKPRGRMEPKWNTLKKKGIMSNDLMNHRLMQMREADSGDLASILKDADQEQIEEDNRLIVRLLKVLDVITPVGGSPNTDFYVPSMLKMPFLYSSTYWERLTASDSEPSRCNLPAPLIVIPTKLKFVPECLFFRLITRFLKVYPNKPRLSRHQCIFLVQDNFKSSPVEVEVELLYHSRGKWVALTIRFIDEEDPKNISKQFLATIRNELCKQMKSVCQQGMRGFKYRICCQTKKAVRADKEFDIDFKRLSVTFDEDCGSSPPQKRPKLYNPFGEPLTVKQDDFQIDCWFEHELIDGRLSSSQDALPKGINKSLIRAVATQVEGKWQLLAVRLGKKAGAIPQYKEKFDDDFLRSMMVIEDWAAESGPEATVDTLLEACKRIGIHRNNIEASYKEEL